MKRTGVITVSQLNYYIKSMFDGDNILQNVFIKGEISNFTDHYGSGHFYLSLKDEKSCIKAIMFSSSAQRVRFRPENGMSVIVRGRISCYEATGQYQLYIEDMQPDGLGALNLAYEQLKTKLSSEGLFGAEKKKSLPKYPSKIAVITSPTGAAICDIKNILSRRYPIAEIILCPVQVQGDQAAEQMIDALQRVNALMAADVIIIGRGGGSIEDLWVFNNEELARAIFASEIPVISAVGHETDYTICDFVADLRAPTPSAAAELAVPDCNEILDLIRLYRDRNSSCIQSKLLLERHRLSTLTSSNVFVSPYNAINEKRTRLDRMVDKISSKFYLKVDKKRQEFSTIAEKLNILNPTNALIRGYSIVQNQKGKIIKSIKGIKNGDNVNLLFQDGEVACKVVELRSLEHEKENSI